MKKNKGINSLIIVVAFVVICLVGAIIKLFYVALSPTVNGINLTKFAESRNTKVKTLHASRGTIYDSSGEALALSVNSYTLIAYLEPKRTTDENNPQHVVDKVTTSEKLAPILGMEKEQILEYLNKDAYQVEFGKKGRNLTENTKKKIDDLELPGIDFIEGSQRYYKMGNFASYIIGYAKANEDDLIKGELGIESFYNKILSGEDGQVKYESDLYGYQLPNRPSYTIEAKSGSDIYLTLDSNIQIKAENGISKLSEDYKFDWAIATIADAKTGAILASATSPSFNPNDLNTLESYVNPLVSYTFEPGSTMKTFTWSAAIEEGIYDGDKKYMSGKIPVADVVISDFNKIGWGSVSYDTGYAYSSNVAATNLALKLGHDKLSEYIQKFGFGKKTGIELSGELKGDIDITYKSELATASFGQGITVTPIQMIQAYTTFANKGVMLKPYIVSKIVDNEGNVTYEGKRKEVGRIISEETTKKMQSLMHNANYEALSKYWQPKTVSMGIKTGTAEIASPKGGYLEGQYDYIYSIAGIFPEDDPEYIIYAAVKRIIGPQKAVANMAIKLVDDVAAYAKITEEEKVDYQNNIIKLDNYKSKEVSIIKDNLKDKLNVVVLGNGKYIISQYPEYNSKIVNNSKLFLITNSNDYVMPDITGWSLSEVKTFANLTKIKLETTGYGYVKEQSIKSDTPIKKDMILKVTLDK